MKIETIYQEINKQAQTLKTSLNKHIDEFLDDLDSENGVVTGEGETDVPKFNKHMDGFFKTHTVFFLAALALGIRNALKSAAANFKGDLSDVLHVERALGIDRGKISKFRDGRMTVLYAIGEMKVIENDLSILLGNAFNGEVLKKDLRKVMKASASRKFHDFFETYALAVIMQSYNTAQLVFARQKGYNKFLYVGGLVDESRDFCIERAGHEFTYEQGKEFNDMWWKGKIEGVDFFIQVGGYNCGHHLEWVKEE